MSQKQLKFIICIVIVAVIALLWHQERKAYRVNQAVLEHAFCAELIARERLQDKMEKAIRKMLSEHENLKGLKCSRGISAFSYDTRNMIRSFHFIFTIKESVREGEVSELLQVLNQEKPIETVFFKSAIQDKIDDITEPRREKLAFAKVYQSVKDKWIITSSYKLEEKTVRYNLSFQYKIGLPYNWYD